MVTPPTQVGCVQWLRGVSQGCPVHVPILLLVDPPLCLDHMAWGTLRVKLLVIYLKLKFNWHPGFCLLNLTLLPGVTWCVPGKSLCSVSCMFRRVLWALTSVCVCFPFKEEVSLMRSIAPLARGPFQHRVSGWQVCRTLWAVGRTG